MIGVISDNNFEYDYHYDLGVCRRYYETGQYVEFSGNVTSGSAYYARAMFSNRKRVTPTVTLSPDPTPSGFPTSGVVSLITDSGFTEGRTASGTGVGRFYSSWTASAEL